MASPAVRAAILHMLPAYLRDAGVRVDRVFHEGGLDAALTATPAIVHRAQVNAVLGAAARGLGEASIGLALGSAADPVRLGSTGVALVSGPSIGASLAGHARQMPAMQTHTRLVLHRDGGQAIWSHRLEAEGHGASWILYEGAAAFHVRFLRSLLGPQWAPSHVTFPHACRGRVSTYEDHFRAPVSFARHGDARIVFDAGLLGQGVTPRPDAAASRDTALPERALATFRMANVELRRALDTLVAARLPHAPVTLAAAAGVLGLAPRTLQRRLGEDGVTFETVVDDIRRDRALARMRAGDGSLTGIAMALGYSDSAHFIRAFRRWTGTTPSAWRSAGR